MWGLLTSKNMGLIWGESRKPHPGKAFPNELPIIIIEFARQQVLYKNRTKSLEVAPTTYLNSKLFLTGLVSWTTR